MKTLLLLAGLFFSVHLQAQKISITEAVENIGDGYNAAYRVFIPHAKIRDVEKKWSSFLKDNKAKVRGPRENLRGEHAVIRGIGPDTIEIFSKIESRDSGTFLVAAFERHGIFISSTISSDDDGKIKQILRDMANSLSVSAIDDESKDAVSILKDKLKEEKALSRKNEHLAEDNERMRKQIKEQEDYISKNKDLLEALKKEIELQQKHIEEIKGKTKELE